MSHKNLCRSRSERCTLTWRKTFVISNTTPTALVVLDVWLVSSLPPDLTTVCVLDDSGVISWPAEVLPDDEHMITLWGPLHFAHLDEPCFAIWVFDKYLKHNPADCTFCLRSGIDNAKTPTHQSDGWRPLQNPQPLADSDDACKAEAAAGFRCISIVTSGSVDAPPLPPDSLNVLERSRLWISFYKNSINHDKSDSLPSPSLAHSILISCGRRERTRRVKITPYQCPSHPRLPGCGHVLVDGLVISTAPQLYTVWTA